MHSEFARNSRAVAGCFIFDCVLPTEFRVTAGHPFWGRQLVFEPGLHLISAPSGRGKTTLLDYMCAFRSPQSGTIVGPKPQSKQYTWSLLAQDLGIPARISVRHIFDVGLPGQTPPSSEALEAALADLGLAAILHRPAVELSRGELQRVLFLRALVQDSEWILMDEPFSHVDSAAEAAMRRALAVQLSLGRSAVITLVQESKFEGAKLWEL